MNFLWYKFPTVQKTSSTRFCLSITATFCIVTPEDLIRAEEEPFSFLSF